jgi:hypothetical protein
MNMARRYFTKKQSLSAVVREEAVKYARDILEVCRKKGWMEKGAYAKLHQPPPPDIVAFLKQMISRGVPMRAEFTALILQAMDRPPPPQPGPDPLNWVMRDWAIGLTVFALQWKYKEYDLAVEKNEVTNTDSACSLVSEAMDGTLSEKQIARIYRTQQRGEQELIRRRAAWDEIFKDQ